MLTAPKTAQYIRLLAIIFLVLVPLSALGTRFGLWPYTIGLLLLASSLLGSLLIQIVNAIWLLRKPAPPIKNTLRVASLIALPPLLLIASIMQGGEGSRAAIHNISTDQENPPQFIAAIKLRGNSSNPLFYGTDIAAIQQKAFPEVDTIKSQLPPELAYQQSLSIAKSLGWRVYSEDPDNGRIEAVETTFWFGFKDDVVIRVLASETGSIIDLRSVSRVGQGDLGANSKRIMKFTKAFKAISNNN